MMAAIKRLEEVLAYGEEDNPWVKVFFDRVELPDGRRARYNRIVEMGSADKRGVAVLPLWNGKVGLVRQYRYPVEEWVWEIPRGFGDSTDARREAFRELGEETGLVPLDLIDLGEFHPNSGLLAARVKIFAACFADEVRSAGPAKGEIDRFEWVPVARVLEMAASGDLKDSFTMVALLRAMQRRII